MTDHKKYLAKIGAKGGKATGQTKARGDAEYYAELARKAAASRKRNRLKKEVK